MRSPIDALRFPTTLLVTSAKMIIDPIQTLSNTL